MYLPEGIPTASRPHVLLLGYERGAITEGCSLCAGPTVLGREGQPTDARLTMPFHKVCSQTEEGSGTIHVFLQ